MEKSFNITKYSLKVFPLVKIENKGTLSVNIFTFSSFYGKHTPTHITYKIKKPGLLSDYSSILYTSMKIRVSSLHTDGISLIVIKHRKGKGLKIRQ